MEHHYYEALFFIVIALFIGAATRHFLRKSPLPFTVMLLIFGIGLGLIYRFFGAPDIHAAEAIHGAASEAGHAAAEHHEPEGFLAVIKTVFMQSINWAGNMNPHLILLVFLPILIFEAAFAMDFHIFKKSVTNATILAVPGIAVALLLTAVCVMGLKGLGFELSAWNWSYAILFGTVISATDPVAVVALLKELGASKKLGTLIEGESLLNDGTAIVIFMVILGGILGETGSGIFVQFGTVSFGGILLGLIIGGIVLAWVKRVFKDILVEITVIVAAAYLTFYVAEQFLHVSGVLGLVALGLAMASAGKTRISPEVQHFLHEFFEMAAFLANVLIFLIVGVVIGGRTTSFTGQDILILLLIYIGAFIVRAIVIGSFFPIMKRAGYGMSKKDAIVSWWGALRGAIGLALALVIAGVSAAKIVPHEITDPQEKLTWIANFETFQHQFLFYVAGIVTLTLLVNATTVGLIVNKLGLTKVPPIKALMVSNAFKLISKSTSNELELLKKDRFMSGANWGYVRGYLPTSTVGPLSQEELDKMDPLSDARRRLLEREKSSYWSQFREGLLGPAAYSRLSMSINDVLDKSGTIPLNDRDYLQKLWRQPVILNALLHIPIVKGFIKRPLFDRLALSYDTARGFVVSQEECAKVVAKMDFDFNQDDEMDEEEAKMASTVTNEINQNRLRGLNYLKELDQAYPNIKMAIETRQAARSILNHEESIIKKLKNDGRLEDDEAQRMINELERRLKKLKNAPLSAKTLEPIEVLKEVSWLQHVEESSVNKVIDITQIKDHPSGQSLINQGDSGEDGMVVIASGSVKVMVGDFTVDLLSAGSVIGEMSVLAGVPRTATVVADTPVTALWMASKDMQDIIATTPELEESLWETAGVRFAENLLGNKEPYINWSQIKMRRWLSSGKIHKVTEKETINLRDSIGVIIAGSATSTKSNQKFESPSIVDASEAEFEKGSWVFLSASVTYEHSSE